MFDRSLSEGVNFGGIDQRLFDDRDQRRGHARRFNDENDVRGEERDRAIKSQEERARYSRF